MKGYSVHNVAYSFRVEEHPKPCLLFISDKQHDAGPSLSSLSDLSKSPISGKAVRLTSIGGMDSITVLVRARKIKNAIKLRVIDEKIEVLLWLNTCLKLKLIQVSRKIERTTWKLI